MRITHVENTDTASSLIGTEGVVDIDNSEFSITSDAFENSKSRINDRAISATDESGLIQKYNQNIYRAPTADIAKSFLKIGPLIYGGEVQDIKILEQKAVEVTSGARVGKDFLTDSGEGRADVQTILVFSGRKHVLEGLIPLIALFKLSPITSVKNSIIESALYDKFTNNELESPDQNAINLINKSLSFSNKYKEIQKVKSILGLEDNTWDITEDQFNEARKRQSSWTSDAFGGQTYGQWKSNLDKESYFVDDPYSDITHSNKTDVLYEAAQKNNGSLRRLDSSGHVPMAMMSLEVETHPELIDTFIVTLNLRRVHIQNYLRDGLFYRKFNNTPTGDPVKAFWLNRAIDLYIQRYYGNGGSSGKELIANCPTGKLRLKYAGEDLILSQFVNYNSIKDFDIIAGSDQSTVVTQISCGIRNKFAFHRLAGESYPTVQHMGYTSCQLTIGIRTNNVELFNQIHTFKTAADFFCRSADRADRFNGWNVDTLATRLFNTVENPDLFTPNAPIRASYFPTSVVTSVVNGMPGVRDVMLTFSDTAIDFFSDFGFTLYTNGVTIDLLYKFYIAIAQHAVGDNADAYSSFLFGGTGRKTENYSLLNPSTIMSAFIERQVYLDGEFKDRGHPEGLRSGSLIIRDLVGEEVYSGIVKDDMDLGHFLTELSSPFVNNLFSERPLSVGTATQVYSENFEPITNIDTKDFLINLIRHIGYDDGRRELYEWLFPRVISGAIKFHDNFIQHLFSAIVKRSPVPISDRLWDRMAVVNAYASLERGLNTNIEHINDLIGDSSHNFLADFNKSKANDNAVVFSPNGSLKIAESRPTSYPDYFYVTYKELFDIEEFGDDNWKHYGNTFQDIGVINPSYLSYNGPDPTKPLTASSVNVASKELVTTATSPVAPSVFFFRETELDQLRDRLDVSTRDWHNTLKTLTVNFPYDVEFLLKNINGKRTGELGIIDANGNIVPVDQITDQQRIGLSSLIGRMNKELRDKTLHGGVNYSKEAERLISAQFRKAKEKFDKAHFSDREFKDYISSLQPNDPKKQELIRFIEDGESIEFFVPIIYSGHANRDVATYKKLSGVMGSAVYKYIVTTATELSGQTSTEFIVDTMTKSAAGLDDGSSITNSAAPELHNSLLKATMSVPDNRHDIIKAFPVFRLYLIDYNKGDRIFVKDNFYGWNSILSIDVTLDKNDSDLAVIRLADPMHILQGSIFEDKLTWNKGIIGNFSLPNSPDDLVDNFMSRFELKQGRAIQIRAGYAADHDNLDIVFTGRIAEVEFGDIVTIVAQGWKSELVSKQVDFELTSVDNSSVKDLVVRTIQDANPAGLGQYFSKDDIEQLNKLLDQDSIDGAFIRSAQNQYGTFGGESGYAGTKGFFGVHWLGGLGRGLDLRLKNIWAPDNEKSRFNYFADIESSGWEGRQWIVPLQPAWDVLQNATNYIWGYICQTVPYDGESTLFFGRPEQLYYFTKGNPKEIKAYREQRNVQLQNFKISSAKLLYEFIGSQEHIGTSFEVLGLFENGNVRSSVNANIKNDGLFGDLTLDIAGAGLIDFSPSKIGFRGYNSYYNLLTAFETGLRNLGLGESSITDFESSDLSEVNPFVSSNLRHDFAEDLSRISSILGNESNAAYMLMMYFYGFSEKYISDNFFPVEKMVRELLSVQSPARLKGIKLSILDSVQHGETIKASNNLFGFSNIDPSIAAKYLQIINDVPQDFAKKFQFVLNPVKQGYISRYIITYDGSSNDSQFVEPYLQAIAAYINDVKSAGRLLNFDTDAEIKAYVNDGLLRGTYLLIETDPVLPILPSDVVVKIANGARLAFESRSRGISNDNVFDNELMNYVSQLRGTDFTFNQNTNGKAIAEYVIQNIPIFRAWTHWLSEWMTRSSSPNQNSVARQHISDIAQNIVFKFPPALNMKPFRDYHYIANGVEIIENNIAASTREMYNTVVLRGHKSFSTSNDAWYKFRLLQGDYDNIDVEDVEWGSWPNEEETGHLGLQFNDRLSLENKKISVFSDLNVDLSRKDQCAKVATNVLAKLIRPMYRNNLMIMGRAIKPWDQIILDDKYVDLYGPIEVERVVHHYNTHQGWITNIVPHAVVEANPGNAVVQRAIIANQWDKIYNVADVALWTITVLTATPTLRAGIKTLTQAGKFGTSKWLSSKFAPTVLTNRLGLQEFVAHNSNVKLLGENMKALKKVLFDHHGAIGNAFFRAQVAEWGAGEFTRIMSLNCGTSQVQLPVTVSPLLFKNVPLEAGLEGQETRYFSLASKVHWMFQDLKDGVRSLSREITSIASRPDSQRINTDYRQSNAGRKL